MIKNFLRFALFICLFVFFGFKEKSKFITPSNGSSVLKLNKISPKTGTQLGKTIITLDGDGFVRGAKVILDSEECLSTQYISPHQLNCVTPGHSLGYVKVAVQNPDKKTSYLDQAFEFHSFPIKKLKDVDFKRDLLSVDRNGCLWVVDKENKRIVKFSFKF